MSLPKPYYETELGRLYHGDCLEILPYLEPVDLVLTSPPYDNLRKYGGFIYRFSDTANCIKSILKIGSVCVWIIKDQTINGSETGTSFSNALYFKQIGLNLYDTMIWNKGCITSPTEGRYYDVFEYMFIFSKEKPKTINFINDRKNIALGSKRVSLKNCRKEGREYGGKCFTAKTNGRRFNVWDVNPFHLGNNSHPAVFPINIPFGHIQTWTNENETVLDTFMGSGTTAVACERLKRRWIGIEIEEKYCEIAAKRIETERRQLKLF